MALTAAQIDKVVSELVHSAGPLISSRADVRAAVVAADQWAADNAAAFNSALPQPFRGAESNSVKAGLLASVALRRFGL